MKPENKKPFDPIGFIFSLPTQAVDAVGKAAQGFQQSITTVVTPPQPKSNQELHKSYDDFVNRSFEKRPK